MTKRKFFNSKTKEPPVGKDTKTDKLKWKPRSPIRGESDTEKLIQKQRLAHEHQKKTNEEYAKSRSTKRIPRELIFLSPCNPRINDCSMCNKLGHCWEENLNYGFRLPHWVVDDLFNLLGYNKLKRTEINLFLYLARKADYNPQSATFGIHKTTYKKINRDTGISLSNMSKYQTNLKKLGLIDVKCVSTQKTSGYETVHYYTVNFIQKQRDLKHILEARE